ncbi:MAG: hypothetical protein JRI89_17235, partial [Deltaproteobacteria bacterium]|nr:hypothetical protein [Deltaproteobacteria bacterium]
MLQELKEIAASYPEVNGYVPGLIHKFLGLALLALGEEENGLNELEKVIGYFGVQFAHVLRVLNATVRAERALYFLGTDRMHEAGV